MPSQPVKVTNYVKPAENESGSILQRPSAFVSRRNSAASGSSPKLPRQGKSLDADDSDHEVEATNYKTSRSQSMATVEFSSIQNPNRVPARWQGVQINSFNQTAKPFNEESEHKPIITNPPRKSYSPVKEYTHPPRKTYSPIKENIPATTGYSQTMKSFLTSRQEETPKKEPTRPNLGELRHPLSRIEAETKNTRERIHSPEQKEQRNTGISPATAYQQYTIGLRANMSGVVVLHI